MKKLKSTAHAMLTLNGKNLTPIRAHNGKPMTYNGHQYLFIPFEMKQSEDTIYIKIPDHIFIAMSYIIEPQVTIDLISCPAHTLIVRYHYNLTLKDGHAVLTPEMFDDKSSKRR